MSLSSAIVIVCVALFIGLKALAAADVLSWDQAVSLLGLSCAGLVERHQFFQLVTAALLHANITHLAFNMLALWMLGPDLERTLGRRGYALFSVVCAASAWTGFLLLDGGRGAIVCGYSGIIFGVLVAQAWFFPSRRIYIYGIFPLRMVHAALILGGIELLLTVSETGSGIAHSAHVFGAAGALVYLGLGRVMQIGARGRTAVAAPAQPVRRFPDAETWVDSRVGLRDGPVVDAAEMIWD